MNQKADGHSELYELCFFLFENRFSKGNEGKTGSGEGNLP
jgi:hypothetical protein